MMSPEEELLAIQMVDCPVCWVHHNEKCHMIDGDNGKIINLGGGWYHGPRRDRAVHKVALDGM